MKGLNVASPLLILSLATQAALADTEFGDSVPREVVNQFIGDQFGAPARIYSDILDAFPAFTVPAGFSVLASADQGYLQRVMLITSLDEEAAETAVMAAFTMQGWQELPAYGGNAPQTGFISATPPPQPLSLCNDAFGRLSISARAGPAPRYVSLSYNAIGPTRNGLQQSCAEEIEVRLQGPGAMRGPQGPQLSQYVPRLIMPESPTQEPPLRGFFTGGGGGSQGDWETESNLVSDLSTDALLEHFTTQVDAQGWTSDSEVTGASVATASWTKTIDGMDLIGLLTIVDMGDDNWGMKFRVVVKSRAGAPGADRVIQGLDFR